MRFEPEYFAEHAGLPAFNGAVQNCRPTDAWAFSELPLLAGAGRQARLLLRGPDGDLRRRDAAPRPVRRAPVGGFPCRSLIEQQGVAGQAAGQGSSWRQPVHRPRPVDAQRLRHRPRTAGLLVQPAPRTTTSGGCSPSTRGPAQSRRARAYFEKTMRLFNAHGVVPAVVIVPAYHRALRAFRGLGSEEGSTRLRAYFATRTDAATSAWTSSASSFGGRARGSTTAPRDQREL